MGKVLEITFVLILVYLVLSRALGFSAAVSAIGKVYVSSVKALQGR
jgi:hypothetical protein